VCGREGHKALDCSCQRRGEGMRLVRRGEGKTQNTGCCFNRLFLPLNQRPELLEIERWSSICSCGCKWLVVRMSGSEDEHTFLPNIVIFMDMRRKQICGRRAGTAERVTEQLAVFNTHL